MKTFRYILLFAVVCILIPLAVARHLQKSNSDGGSKVSDQVLKVLKENNSALTREVLDNGMICLVKQDSSAPVVSVQVWVRTGSIHEDKMLGSGLSHAIEHMIFKGTEKMSPGDVSRLINNAGGDVNAYTSFDRTVFHADMPREGWKTGLSVIADVVKDPAFPKEEWDKEREVILREFAMGRDDPGRVIDKSLWHTAFAVHPYRFPIIGIEESFRRITRDDLMSFFRENYVADNMIAVVVGDVTKEEAMSELKAAFGEMLSTPRKSIILPLEPRQMASRFLRQTGNWNISRCEIGYHTVSLSHPDAVALDVISEILGHGRSSRLVKSIREEKQLVHGIGAYSYTPLEPGLFGVHAEFDADKETEVLEAINEELEKALGGGFTQEELSRARRQLMTSSVSSLQTMKGQANSYAAGEFYSANPFFTTAYLEQLALITTDELERVARRYIVPENSSTVIIAPENSEPGEAEETDQAVVNDPVKTITPSGVNLIVREDHRLPFVYFCVTLKDGFLAETESNTGITRLMSDMMIRGTQSLTTEEISLEIESRGGSLTAFSGINSFGLRAKCLTPDSSRFMQILSDCLINPEFPEKELDKQKKLQLAAISQEKEQPIALAQEQLRNILFPAHPCRFSPLGTTESVPSISRSMLQEFHGKLLAKNRMVVSIFGDITPEQAVPLVEASLSSIPSVSDGLTTAEPPNAALPERKVVSAPREQTIILVGYPGLPISDPRNDALMVLDEAMSGLSSEIAMEVREKRGLAYFVGSFQQMSVQGGAFVMYAGTQESAMADVEHLMHKEAERVTTAGISEEEFNRARTQVIAGSDMAMQNNYDMAMKSALDELLGLGFDHSFKAGERFNNLKLQDIKQASAVVLKPESMATAIVVPEKSN